MSNASLQPILALLGHGASANPTQYMVEKAFTHHQLDWRYVSFEVAPEHLGDAVRGLRAMGFRGGNCTEPHKQAVLEYLDRRSQAAELVGVTNCILREDEQLIGENTEGKAFVQAVRRRTDPAGKRVVLLGAGRMARAIAVELALAGAADLTIINRTEQSGRELVDLLGNKLQATASFTAWDGEFELPAGTGLVINATSIGSEDPDAPLPLALETITDETVVADVTIDPPDTWLIHEADERGAATLDGLEIFIDQTAINFKLWTGVDPDTSVLREAVEEFLEL